MECRHLLLCQFYLRLFHGKKHGKVKISGKQNIADDTESSSEREEYDETEKKDYLSGCADESRFD